MQYGDPPVLLGIDDSPQLFFGLFREGTKLAFEFGAEQVNGNSICS